MNTVQTQQKKIEDDINTFINANNRKYDLFIYIIIA